MVGLDIKGDCLHCDVRDPGAVHAALEKIGRVDVLINNAGILSNNKAEATTPEEWHDVLASNVDSAFYFSQKVIPGMKARRWGRIVNTCSLAAKTGGLPPAPPMQPRRALSLLSPSRSRASWRRSA